MNQIKMSLAVMALLGLVSAEKIEREPLLSWKPKTSKISHPMDYPVANFGRDTDIIDTQQNIGMIEKQFNHTLSYGKKPAEVEHPVNYFVPNFGQDSDITTSQANVVNAERSLGHKLHVLQGEKKDDHPVNYYVPNFGADHDVISTQNSATLAEKSVGHKWNIDLSKKKKDASYTVPDFGLDHDITTSLNNLHTQESIHGRWDLPEEEDIQVDENREPLLTWKPKAPATHPVDYFVPNFGVDHDILDTQAHTAQQEQLQNHQWNPKKDEEDKWILPSHQIEFKLAQVEREPLLSWKPKVKASHPVDYFVPSFGVDEDIKTTQNNIEKYELKFPSHESNIQLDTEREPLLTWKPKAPASHPVDYFVPNFGLDQDILDSQAHSAQQEKLLNHQWNPEQDEDDKWILPSPQIEFKLLQTDSELEREPLLSWKPKSPKSHPVDYFVPNFGADHDVLHTQKHLSDAEKRLGHTWNWEKPPKKEDPTEYLIKPLDPEIKDSLKNMADQEDIHGVWNLPPLEDE